MEIVRWVLDIFSSILELCEKYIFSQELSGLVKSWPSLARNIRTSVSKSLLSSQTLELFICQNSFWTFALCKGNVYSSSSPVLWERPPYVPQLEPLALCQIRNENQQVFGKKEVQLFNSIKHFRGEGITNNCY